MGSPDLGKVPFCPSQQSTMGEALVRMLRLQGNLMKAEGFPRFWVFGFRGLEFRGLGFRLFVCFFLMDFVV